MRLLKIWGWILFAAAVILHLIGMLGGEYSVVFHEGGTADLVIAGAAMPGATWTLDDSGAVLVDYYGMAFSFVPADNGFTMDYYGTMLLTYTAE